MDLLITAVITATLNEVEMRTQSRLRTDPEQTQNRLRTDPEQTQNRPRTGTP